MPLEITEMKTVKKYFNACDSDCMRFEKRFPNSELLCDLIDYLTINELIWNSFLF